jgi:multidrug resistance efflux pump
MIRKLSLVAAILVCVALGLSLRSIFADSNAPNAWKGLEKNYATANLELAEARLAQAKSENETVNDSISDAMISELAAGVQLAQGRLKLIESGDKGNPYAPQIKSAEDVVSTLKNNYTESVKANKLEAGAVPDAELRREKAEIAVAEARLAAVKALDQQPPEVRIEWELGQLHDQIRALWARPLIED